MNRRNALRACIRRRAAHGLGAAGGETFAIGVPGIHRAAPAEFVLRNACASLGYEEGRNLIVDYRFAEGQQDRLPGLAADLVANKVDLIVAVTNPEILAAKRATTTIPIVMMYSSTPVETGLVASLARPGGNVTGTTIQGPETAGKILEVLHDAVPRAKRVALLFEPEFPGMQFYLRATERAAEAMGIRLTLLPGRSLAELETAFAVIARERPDALYVAMTGAIATHRARVIEFAARERVPAIYTGKLPVTEGGLMAYSQDFGPLVRRTAAIIDRILKGAKPADLPVEQPTNFELIINMKTANALGLTIPQSLLLRADEVIR